MEGIEKPTICSIYNIWFWIYNPHRYSCMSEDLLNTVVCQEAYVGTAASDVKRAVALAEVGYLL